MTTKIFEIEEVQLIAPEGFEFKSDKILQYPDCCGPGTSFFAGMIPETINGVGLGPACDIHDYEWNTGEKSWEHFHASNGRFIRNMFALFNKFADQLTPQDRLLTSQAIVGYYLAVDTAGVVWYWRD